MRGEIDRVRVAIEDSSRANHDASERIKISEYDLAQSRIREEDLKRQIAGLESEIARKNQELVSGDSEISNLRDSIRRGEEELDDLQRRYDQQVMDGSKIQRQREEERLRNIEFTNISKDLESKIRNKEVQIDGLRSEAERLR